MNPSASSGTPVHRLPPTHAVAPLSARLETRLSEIEQTVLSRVYAVADPSAVGDPAYVDGLRGAVSAALGYAIAALDGDGDRPAPVPAPLLAQARRAAREGVPLDTVLRRYLAGHALLDDFIVQEMGKAGHGLYGDRLQSVLRREAAILDHLLSVVACEYRSECDARDRSQQRRRVESVEKLLAGELADPDELGYDLDLWHTGLIAVGRGAERAVRAFAGDLDRRLLLVPRGEETVWAWLGAVRRGSREDLVQLTAWKWPAGVRVATGEPDQGPNGWRFTHQQASAAMPIALRGEQPHVRYADVALLASIYHDDVLVESLYDLYLAPLSEERDGGEALKRTLRSYFQAERNVSSAAASLGVTRKTVSSRLQTIEQRLGRPLHLCSAEIETALRLEEMGRLDPIARDRFAASMGTAGFEPATSRV